MFGDESQNKEKPLNRLTIAIVDPKFGENELFNSLNKKIKEEPTNFRISILPSLEDLYQKISPSLYDNSNCLLNLQWIDLVYDIKPSVLILYYYIKEGSTKEDEELSISKIIDTIKSYDQHLPIYLFIIVPPQEYDKYQHLKDDDKSVNSLRKKLKKENYYVFTSKDVLKTIEMKKLYDNLVIYSRNYYKQVKNVLISKINEAKYTELHIKYTIMIAILSIVKSKKKNPSFSKYLKEAYDALVGRNFNYKNYYYGNNNIVHNFFEVKAVADWVLFKIIKLKKEKNEEPNVQNNKKKIKVVEKNKNLDIQFKIDIFIDHIKKFSSHDFGLKKDDPFYFYMYFWMYKRYINLSNFCDEYFNELKDEKKYLLKISQIKFYMLYTFLKLMKFYQRHFMNLDLNNITIDNKKIPISSIILVNNYYYGKPPIYAYKLENSEEIVNIGYNDEAFLKLTIINNNLTLDNLDKTLKDELIKNILSFYYRDSILEKGFEISNFDIANEIEIAGLKLYLNILRFYINYPNYKNQKNMAQYIDEKDINFELYKICERSSNLKKFPKMYIRFLSKLVEFFIYQRKNTKENEKFNNIKKTILFKSLSILSSIRILSEQEQDIYNELLDDVDFIPTPTEKEEKKPIVSLEINDLFAISESDTDKKETIKKEEKNKEELEKNIIKKYIKDTDTIINLYCSDKLNNKEEKGISFEYNINDIDKSQERKILDLVEYEFKISTKLSKLRLKFENIKIFFIYLNNGVNTKYESEIILKEFDSEYLSNKELTVDTPINLEHKIFLKYREGKIKVMKILATLSKKKDIVYSIDFPNDIQKIIFIKNVQTNVLNFYYDKNFKVGKNQYNPFELQITKEKNDEVEIKDLKIEFQTFPTFHAREYNSFILSDQSKNPETEIFNEFKSVITPNKINNGTKKNTISEALGLNNKETPSDNTNISIDFSKLNSGFNNTNTFKGKNIKRSLRSAIKGNRTKRHYYIPPEFYYYNDKGNRLDKYEENMEILYNNFESLLNQGRNKYTTIIRFLSEGPYKVKFSVVYFIRHIKLEEYIKYSEENILEFEVINPFSLDTNASSNNFYSQNKNNTENNNSKEKQRFYLTNCKINMNFILNNKLENDIKIKDIKIITDENNSSIKYITSYISDLIHLYDLDTEEKNEMLLMKKNSSYTLPFEVEFSQPFKGSIGKINLIWSTEALDNFENGKLNILNQEVYSFPEIEVRPLEFEYKYNTKKNENGEIELELCVKNVSNQTKKIMVYIFNNNEESDKEFIFIGIDKQTHLITINEEIKFNYTLIPISKGEFDYPCFQIVEYDLINSEKKNINNYYSDNIAII